MQETRQHPDWRLTTIVLLSSYVIYLCRVCSIIKICNQTAFPSLTQFQRYYRVIHMYSTKLLLKYCIYTDCYYTNCSYTDCYYCFFYGLLIIIILYHWKSHPLLHTIKLVYRNNHHLYKHILY